MPRRSSQKVKARHDAMLIAERDAIKKKCSRAERKAKRTQTAKIEAVLCDAFVSLTDPLRQSPVLSRHSIAVQRVLLSAAPDLFSTLTLNCEEYGSFGFRWDQRWRATRWGSGFYGRYNED